MIKRIVDISEPSYLHTDKEQLRVDRDGETIASIPIEDLGDSDPATSGHCHDAEHDTPLPAE